MAINLTPNGLDSTVSGEMPNYPIVFSRVGGTTSWSNTGGGGSTGYGSPAIRIGTLGLNESYVNGRYIKTGDLNYSNQQTDIQFECHIWGVENTKYNLWAKANLGMNNRNCYLWVNSSRELWLWQDDIWNTHGRLIIEASSNVDLTSASDPNIAPAGTPNGRAWTGQTRQLVNNSTSISLEDTFGSPA
jgi:hypothetical protein